VNSPPDVAWASRDADTAGLAAFFVQNVDASYISHGEVFCGRATDPRTWAPDLEQVVRRELDGILAGAEPCTRVAVAREGGALVGWAIVELVDGPRHRHAVIEDVIVATAARGVGRGKAFLDALIALLRAEGVGALFLESGIANARAHAFFAREGFEVVSKVMYRSL
jgi:ribosomal protein S18 acetylase RimI-like enzyme